MIVIRTKEGSKEGREREKETGHRTTLLTPELSVKLIGLFEEYFFVGMVAAEEGTHRQRIEEWEREQEAFRAPLTHARQRQIKQDNIKKILQGLA